MEDEAWKEEYRKRAEERVRAVEAAQARIDALIARAGGPVMAVRNTQESEKEKHDDTIQALFDIADYKNGGDLTVWIRELNDTIDRLEAALHNVINEREQLKRDLHDACTYDWFLRPCHFCAHLEGPTNETPCGTCLRHKGKPGFEWHGVPDKEEESDEH